jgi:WhiB family redox-sensing transcriptional regulator
MDWRESADCTQHDPELFFPVGKNDLSMLQAQEAINICNNCQVREKCLEAALKTTQKYGIWGGKTEEQRSEIITLYHNDNRGRRRRTSSPAAQAEYFDGIMAYVPED